MNGPLPCNERQGEEETKRGKDEDCGGLPIVTAGSLHGGFPTGQHYKIAGKAPLANLWLSLLQRAGVETDRFADSKETLL
jgi:hypothetical protein